MEKIDVEFKESKKALAKDVFNTACSFNNRNGGHILLGVNDKREIVGVSKDSIINCNLIQKAYFIIRA